MNNGSGVIMHIHLPGVFQVLSNDLYLVFVIGLMFFLLIGQYFRWVGLIRDKHRGPSLSLLLCLFGLGAVTSYILGWWLSYAFSTGPGNHWRFRRCVGRVAVVRDHGPTRYPALVVDDFYTGSCFSSPAYLLLPSKPGPCLKDRRV